MLSPAPLALLLYIIYLARFTNAFNSQPDCPGLFDKRFFQRYTFPDPGWRLNSDACVYNPKSERHIRSLNCLCLPDGRLRCLGFNIMDTPLLNNRELRNLCYLKCSCQSNQDTPNPDLGGIKLPRLKISRKGSDGLNTGSTLPGTEETTGTGSDRSSGSAYRSVLITPKYGSCASHCSSNAGCSETRKRAGCRDSICVPRSDTATPYFYVGTCTSASLLGKRDLGSEPVSGCLCNSSYVGKECCYSETGIVHTQHLLAFG